MKILLVIGIVLLVLFAFVALWLIIWAARTGDKKNELIRIVRDKITEPEEIHRILEEYRDQNIIRYYEIDDEEHLMVEKVIYYNKSDNLNELTPKREDIISIDWYKRK